MIFLLEKLESIAMETPVMRIPILTGHLVERCNFPCKKEGLLKIQN